MSSSRALANQEREVQVKRLSKLAKGVLLSAATLMTFATVTLLALDKLYRPDAFVINQLKITGKFSNTTPESVQKVVFQEPLGNFFSIELDAIKNRVMSMPWILSADVRREWPHTLSVTVQEHRPVMRWYAAEGVDDDVKQPPEKPQPTEQWVSANGDIISLDVALNLASPMSLKGTERDARQLLSQAITWRQQLANSGVNVIQVQLTPSQSWRLTLSTMGNEEFELLLGRENASQRLTRFQTLFDQQLKGSEQQLIRVDARYPDGLAIRARAKQSDPAEPSESNSMDEVEASAAVNELTRIDVNSALHCRRANYDVRGSG